MLYGRVSHDPTGKGRSVDSQLDECRTWSAREGWAVAAEVRDVDRSASRHAKRAREGWSEVVALLESGAVDVLVTWEASRAQRDLEAFTALRSICERTGTRWAYSGTVYDLADRADRFRTGLDALVAEDEAERTSERVQRGLQSAAMQGRPPGRKLYGYRRIYDEHTGELLGQEPDGEGSEVVLEVAERFAAGESLRAIAADLNARMVPTPKHGPKGWGNNHLHRLMSNPAFNAQRVHKGEIVGPAGWEPIIDDALWARVQARLADPARQNGDTRQRGNAYLLTGIARCAVCGERMQYSHDRGRRQYACRGRHVARDGAKLDAYVVATVLERLGRPDVVDLLDTEPPPDVLGARAEVAEYVARIDAATEQFIAGNLSADVLGRVETECRKRIAELTRRTRYAGVPTPVADLIAADDIDAAWDVLTREQQREILRSLVTVRVDRIGSTGVRGFDPDAVDVDWRAD